MMNALKIRSSILALAAVYLAQDGLTIDKKHKEREQRGAWLIHIMELRTKEQFQLTKGDCNSVSPAGRLILRVSSMQRIVGMGSD
jgi:hypothetical protein